MKINIKNERIKRRFFRWLKEADGCCDSTIKNIENSMLLYEEFTKGNDFVTYGPDKAIEFKKWLSRRKFRSKIISPTTYYTYLRYLRKFFLWLSWQSGYKSKIRPDTVSYLNISEKEERIATQNIPRNYPPLEYVIELANSIEANIEIDQRDRALISFTLLSGMRDKAIVTLPLGCFDEDNLIISQNPKQGVQTKFSKYIPSALLNLNDKLLKHITDWVKYLKAKGFGSEDPLFPHSKTGQGENNLSFEPANEIEPVFWQGTGRMREIFKKRAIEANLPYYPPHTYRHLAIDLALKHCKDGEQIKAVSQNFGHEHVMTTLSSYGNYKPQRLAKIIKDIDFSDKPNKTKFDKIEEIRKIILDS